MRIAVCHEPVDSRAMFDLTEIHGKLALGSGHIDRGGKTCPCYRPLLAFGI